MRLAHIETHLRLTGWGRSEDLAWVVMTAPRLEPHPAGGARSAGELVSAFPLGPYALKALTELLQSN